MLCEEGFFRDLMDSIPDVIYFKDRVGRLVLVNKAHARGLGLKPEEVIGKTDFDIFGKSRAQKMLEDDMRVIKTGKPIIDKIERATRADGVDNYVSTTKIPRYDSKGNIIGLIGITRDITRRMQLERLKEENANIEKKIQALKQLNRMKSEFISIASHELRTPLAIVKEALLLMSEGVAGAVNEKQRRILINANKNVERLNRLIEDLLDVSRIERKVVKLHYSLVNFNELLEDSSGFFKKTAQDKGLSLEYSLPRKQINIFIDAERVNQIISNLINNAIKFTEEGGKVKIEVKVLEHKVRVGVIDTGIGISRQDLPRLFNKFVQVSRVPEAEKKGLGLGIYIARELVAMHGGEIWVESKPGVGSKFYFTLPRLYTSSLLEVHVREKINSLLDLGIAAYLVSISIVNFTKFRRHLGMDPKQFMKEVEVIVNRTFSRFGRANKESPRILFSDNKNAELSIVFPQATESEAERLCALIREGIYNYLKNMKIEKVFVNLAVLSYSPQGRSNTNHEFLANLNIKKLYIGSEVRRHKRINYKAGIEVISGARKNDEAHTLDISSGGLCFVSKNPLETDSEVILKLRLFTNNAPIHIRGRVAWIKNIDPGQYKIGIEFVDLRGRAKAAILKFIKSASA